MSSLDFVILLATVMPSELLLLYFHVTILFSFCSSSYPLLFDTSFSFSISSSLEVGGAFFCRFGDLAQESELFFRLLVSSKNENLVNVFYLFVSVLMRCDYL
jgi:hypothetical protein